MKVSVIIAAYNIQDYIERCLISVVNQTLKEIEIIVVNDGSKDNTLEIIKNIANEDDRIIIVDQQNKGLIEARKSGLSVAKGEYILFIDGDDWLEIEALDKLYINAKKYNSDIVLYNTFWSYDDKKDRKCTFENNDLIKEDPLKSLFIGLIKPSIWAKLVRREYLYSKKIKFPSNISFGEDLATVASWFMNNPSISSVDEYLYNYYQRESSITQSIDKKVLEVNKAVEFIKENLINRNIYDKYKIYFEYMIYTHIFESKFLVYNNFDYIHKTLYNQYKSNNINISNNKYILDRISKYPKGLKVRQYMYCKGYKIGKLYDRLRKVIR